MFKCYETLHDTVWNSELGSSLAIFNAGYTIDSLLLKYQGADWLDKDNWNCNAGWAQAVLTIIGRMGVETLCCCKHRVCACNCKGTFTDCVTSLHARNHCQ